MEWEATPPEEAIRIVEAHPAACALEMEFNGGGSTKKMLPLQLALAKGADLQVAIRVLEAPDAGSSITELKCDGKVVGDGGAQSLCVSLAAHAASLTALDLSLIHI